MKKNSARPSARRSINRTAGVARRFTRRATGRFTARAAILALVIVLLVLTLTYPAKKYFAQHDKINQLEADEQRQADRIAALKERKENWRDPAYIKAQARKRLQYVEPGEVAYVIIEDPKQLAAEKEAKQRKKVQAAKHGPWYGQLWSTVEAADDPAPASKK
jgi:cell division protein FtsB